MKPGSTARILQLSVAAFLVAVLVSQALFFVPPAEAKVTTSFHWERSSDGSWRVELNISSTFAGDFGADAVLAPLGVRSDQVYFYYDSAYPSSESDLPDWFGLSQHLSLVADARDQAMDLHLVNATQLESVLTNSSTTSAAVVFDSGVLPATVFSATRDLLTPWIKSGGLAIWAGNQIGAYSGTPGAVLACGTSDTLGQAGTARIVNASWLVNNASFCPGPGPPPVMFLNQSASTQALGVFYPYGLPAAAVRVSNLETGGGFALGGTYDNTTNVAFLPLGEGGLLDIDGPTTDTYRLSISIDNLLMSDLLEPRSERAGYDEFALAAGSEESIVFTFPSTVANPGLSPCLFAVQTDYLATFAANSCAPDTIG